MKHHNCWTSSNQRYALHYMCKSPIHCFLCSQMAVQHLLLLSLLYPPQVEEYADEVFDLLNNGAHMYFCGLKGMMPGILDMLQRVSKEKGINFEEFVEGLKHKNQWHVEVRTVQDTIASSLQQHDHLMSSMMGTQHW